MRLLHNSAPPYMRLFITGQLQYLIEPRSGVEQKRLKSFGSRYIL
jgi:hypothetical protein